MNVGSRQARLVQAVRSSALMGGLPSDLLAELLSSGRVAHVGPQEQLRRADDDVVALVLDGVAIGTLLADDGSQVIAAILDAGTAGGLPVVLGQISAGMELTGLTAVDALLLPGPELRRYLSERPELVHACLSTVTAELAHLRVEEARFAYTTTTERVVHRLLELAERWGESVDGQILIRLPLTQEMLASWARSSRESTAKILHELRQSGVIRTGRRELTILDLERLLQRCNNHHRHTDEVMRTLLSSIG
jgi:CRP/FNR family transcriptional regulator, cyclic AMP receptor protein